MTFVPTCVFNEYCGHGSILRAACGASGFVPIRGRVQHGWSPIAGGMAIDRLTDAGEPLFFWSERAKAEFLAEHPGYPRALAIGAPFLYLPPVGVLPARDRTLLAFPFHGTVTRPLADDAWAACATGLANLGRRLGATSVVVCLYDLEAQDDSVRATIESAGLGWTTLGSPWAPGYLTRFRDLVSVAAAVVASRPCTALLYAMALGHPVMVQPDDLRFSDPDRLESTTASAEWCRLRFPALYRGEPVRDDSWRVELGADAVLPPDRLFEALYGWTQVN